jgi:fermentation-respiration switch protein FrsA (DUF1100 family)
MQSVLNYLLRADIMLGVSSPAKGQNAMWQIFLQLLILITAIYVGLAIFLFFTQSRLIYFPTREIVSSPDQIGLSYKSVSFKAPDGVRLSGWFIPADSPRGVVIFCHGNAGNISHRLESIEIFHRLRLSTFIFDYRGYGMSEGTPSEQGSYLDMKGAWNYLIEHEGLAPSDIILIGRSLGGAVAAWLARQHTPKALIIESTFTSAPDLAGELYFYLPVKLLCRYKYNALAAIREVRCPVLIVHSQEDEIVPFRHGRILFDAANEPKTFLEISGSHNEGFITSSDVYINGLKTFLDQVDGILII